jgi:hypothetical protein
VALSALALLTWYVSVLFETNAGWGWGDPEFAAPWRGRQLALWISVAVGAAIGAAAIWVPSRWITLSPALIGALTLLLIRRLYLIGSPPDYFLADQASVRWYFAASCVLQAVALALTLPPPARRDA